MMGKWDYGNYAYKYDFDKTIELDNGKLLAIDIFSSHYPSFMKEADLLFVDPPWNLGNLNSFYTKADMSSMQSFENFYKKLFDRIHEINPETVFIEIGKQYLGEFLVRLNRMFKYVTFYNSTYYKKNTNKCYVIHGTNVYKKRRYKELEDLDEEEIIKWITSNIDYKCIGDLCMGKGLVAYYSSLNGKKFVGTELNKKRLAVAIERVIHNNRKIGGK